ncbi:MAG: hypothetical protein ACK5QH_10740 [Rubrivivax sp.]
MPMMQTQVPPIEPSPSGARWDGLFSGRRAALAGAGLMMVLGLAAAGAAGGWTAAVGALLTAGAALGATLTWRLAAWAEPELASDAPAGAAPLQRPPQDDTARQGIDLMVTQIVPVWERQLLASREAAEQGLAKLLESFAGISSAADEVTARLSQAASGLSLNGEQMHEHPALVALHSASRRAFQERDAAYAVLARSASQLQALQQLTTQFKELARHTRLVAFNSSIESQRKGQGPAGLTANGAQAVSLEIRTVSTQMAEAAEKLDVIGSTLLREVGLAHREGEVHRTGDEALRLELELRAGEALQALGGEIGQTLAGSGALAAVSEQLGAQITEAYTHFQFGDRLSQMLAILASDMNQLTQWVKTHPVATRQDAAQWLEALERSYTMEEQRSEHHGNVHVSQSTGVDFF